MGYTEKDLQDAIAQYHSGRSSIQKTAQEFGIPPSTLQGRVRGHQPRSTAAERLQLITPAEEARLAKWLSIQATLGHRLPHRQIRELASRMLQKQESDPTPTVGKGWVAGFIRRNPILRDYQRERTSRIVPVRIDPVQINPVQTNRPTTPPQRPESPTEDEDFRTPQNASELRRQLTYVLNNPPSPSSLNPQPPTEIDFGTPHSKSQLAKQLDLLENYTNLPIRTQRLLCRKIVKAAEQRDATLARLREEYENVKVQLAQVEAARRSKSRAQAEAGRIEGTVDEESGSGSDGSEGSCIVAG